MRGILLNAESVARVDQSLALGLHIVSRKAKTADWLWLCALVSVVPIQRFWEIIGGNRRYEGMNESVTYFVARLA